MAAKFGIKVILPSYDASSDNDPNHHALYANPGDLDYVLIKESLVGSKVVSAHGSQVVAHGLGYVPFCLAFVESSAGEWRKLFSRPIDGTGFYFAINATNLTLYNDSANSKTFAYHIFLDNIT